MGPETLAAGFGASKSIWAAGATIYSAAKQLNRAYIQMYYGVTDASKTDAIERFDLIRTDVNSVEKLISFVVKKYNQSSATSKSESKELLSQLENKSRSTAQKSNDIEQYLATSKQGRMLSVLVEEIKGFDLPSNVPGQ